MIRVLWWVLIAAAAAGCQERASANPLARPTIHAAQGARLDEILTEVRAIRALLEARQPPVEPAPPAPTPSDPTPKPPDAPPAEPPPTGPNPFFAWRAQGLSITDIMLWRLGGRGLTAEERAQAAAAGYDLEPPAGAGGRPPPGDSGFDRSPDFGADEARVKHREGAAGATWRFTASPPPGFRGSLAVKVAESPSRFGQVLDADVWFERAECPGVAGVSAIYGQARCAPTSDGPIAFRVRIRQTGRVAVKIGWLP